jgi:electron transfer flavoprotein alpha/beta subunit
VNVIVCLHAAHVDASAGAALGRDDAHALAHALALTAPGSTQVSVLLAGDAADAGPLQQALELGAARAVRVAGDDLDNADFHTLGQVLASGIKRLGADLVLAGARSDDEGLGAVPAATARQLGFVYVSAVEEVGPTAPGPDGAQAIEVVVRGGGRKRRLRVTLPAVLSIVAGPHKPAPAPSRTGARPEIEVLSLADPESTVVRRRTELLGKAEPASRGTETVTSASALMTALTKA